MQEAKGVIGPPGIDGEVDNSHEFIRVRLASPEESRAKVREILAKQARNQLIIASVLGGLCVTSLIGLGIKFFFFS